MSNPAQEARKDERCSLLSCRLHPVVAEFIVPLHEPPQNRTRRKTLIKAHIAYNFAAESCLVLDFLSLQEDSKAECLFSRDFKWSLMACKASKKKEITPRFHGCCLLFLWLHSHKSRLKRASCLEFSSKSWFH